MPPRIVQSNPYIGNRIKEQRILLNLSIEEAARISGVGAKTWGRYEAGQSIRADKVKGVCKALKWKTLPADDNQRQEAEDEYAWLEEIDSSDEGWSAALNETYGRKAAVSFAVGSAALLDYMNEDLNALKEHPASTHLSQIPWSYLADMLPGQYLMRYDYDFLFRFRAALISYRNRVAYGEDLYAHTVAEELLVRLIRDLSFDSVSDWEPRRKSIRVDGNESYDLDDLWEDWPENLCDDDDASYCLDDDRYTEPGEMFSFERWFEPQFWVE